MYNNLRGSEYKILHGVRENYHLPVQFDEALFIGRKCEQPDQTRGSAMTEDISQRW